MTKNGRQTGANLGFEDKHWVAADKFYEQMAKSSELDAMIRKNLEALGYGE